MNKTCICIIARSPSLIWLDFLSNITQYDVVIVCDDNSVNYSEKYAAYKSIKFVQIPDIECAINSFTHSCTATIRKVIISWDKALYYFSSIFTNYEHIWFMEDDAFFHSEQTLIDIDNKYTKSDLLSNEYVENLTGDKSIWHWRYVHIDIPPPYYKTMICAVRMSRELLQKIREYTQRYRRLFFIEAMFPTICKRSNLTYDTPSELNTITFDDPVNENNINKVNLFHPVKDINKHVTYRELLDKV